jgi:hypothetical protein
VIVRRIFFFGVGQPARDLNSTRNLRQRKRALKLKSQAVALFVAL